MRFLSTLAIAALLALPAAAQTLFMMPSSTDLSVSGNATAEFTFTNRRQVDWIWIKTHCGANQSLYFGLLRPRTSFPIRLTASQEFMAPVRVVSVGASNPSGTACTFSLQGAHY